MNDTISRQAANDAIESAFDRETILNRFVRKIAISAVRLLPSAQPEQKKGEWVPYSPEGLRYKCSECDSKYETPWHYCPNCGSYNGGESDDKG